MVYGCVVDLDIFRADAGTSASPYLYKRVDTIHVQEGMGASAGTLAKHPVRVIARSGLENAIAF
jgi:hypothetical protein